MDPMKDWVTVVEFCEHLMWSRKGLHMAFDAAVGANFHKFDFR
jgi:hypothetical protein